MKTRLISILINIIIITLLFPGLALGQAPTPPLLFEGKVYIDGVEAPADTVIIAEIDDIEVASTAITEESLAQDEGSAKYYMTIPNEGYIGKTVVFKVDGNYAGEGEYINPMEKPIVELDLEVGAGAPTTPETNGTSSSSDANEGSPGKEDESWDYWGLGLKAFIGIIVGGIALIVIIIVIIRRERQYI